MKLIILISFNKFHQYKMLTLYHVESKSRGRGVTLFQHHPWPSMVILIFPLMIMDQFPNMALQSKVAIPDIKQPITIACCCLCHALDLCSRIGPYNLDHIYGNVGGMTITIINAYMLNDWCKLTSLLSNHWCKLTSLVSNHIIGAN